MSAKINSKVIGIIGGKGLMGTYFAKLFKKSGFYVLISDIDTKLSNRDLIEKSDIVIFSVPLHLSMQIIKENVKFLREDQLVMDFTSLKQNQIKEMLKSKSQVIGLHPMFGPSVDLPNDQIIIFCPIRTHLETEVRKFFENFGFVIKKIDPKKHDALMAIVQVLIHFKAIVLGKALEKMGINIDETLNIASPVYEMELAMIGRIFAQDAKLYGAIEIMNPETKKVLKVLENSFDLYKEIVLKKDLNAFCKEFDKTSKSMGKFCKKALNKTSKIFKYL